MSDGAPVLARVLARGHPAIGAGHAKTLEITADAEITQRAGCVVGVGGQLPRTAVAGPITVALSVESASVEFTATGHSGWTGPDSIVIRRSQQRRPDTFATGASMTAATLPRELAARLADPDSVVELRVLRRPGPRRLLRFRAGPGAEPRLRAELAAADTVLAEDAGARALLRAAGVAPAGSPGPGRTLSVSTTGAGPGPGLPADEVIGWPAELVPTVAAGSSGPELHAGALAPAELARLAAACPAAALVVATEAPDLSRLLATVGRGDAGLVGIALDNPELPFVDPPDRGRLLVRIAARATDQEPPLNPGAVVAGLLEQGVSVRTVARTLAGLPGWSRRAAYDFVLAHADRPRPETAEPG